MSFSDSLINLPRMFKYKQDLKQIKENISYSLFFIVSLNSLVINPSLLVIKEEQKQKNKISKFESLEILFFALCLL